MLPRRLRDAAAPCLWIGGVLTASLLVTYMMGPGWGSMGITLAFMLIAAGQLVKGHARLRQVLTETRQERDALAQTLLQAQKMEALGRLTVGCAHDFNNHLTVISSNVELLAKRLGSEHAGLLRHTDAAMQGVRRAATLTGRLLSFSRQTPIEPEILDVDRLVGSMADLLRRMLGGRVKLDLQLSGMPWFARADLSQMENALLSLAANARDRIPQGGTMRIMVCNVQLDARSDVVTTSVLPGDYIQVSIGSSGHPADAGRWHPADDLTSADLFMVRTFIRSAGGCLLRSDPTLPGFSLRMLLPRYALPATTAPSNSGADRRTTILVVEDEPAIRTACVETLRQLGYRVLDAPDAMEAVRLIADQGGIDLLFTDLGVPGGVSGRALADTARNVDPNIRVLFTTGHERPDLPKWAAAALLRKPFDQAQLAAKIRDVLAAECPFNGSVSVPGAPQDLSVCVKTVRNG